MDYILGIDLGGTKIECALLTKEYQIIDRMRIPTESEKGYEAICKNIAQIIHDISSKHDFKAKKVGIGTPGTLDPIINAMKNCNATALNGKNLKKDLESLLNMEVRLANDANCFAIAEAKMGVVRDVLPQARNVFGVIMGTGVGGGVVIHDVPIGGRQGIGGEWGHNLLEEDGSDCYCGKKGCVETVISGPALENFYAKISGQQKQLKDIVLSYRNQSDAYANVTMQRLFKQFGKAIAVVINILDPDAIVIGGGVGNIDELYTLGVEEVKHHVFNHRLDTLFLKPKLGDSAGVFGAAML
jgi:predicted NBD/HSP70 family sugar kinase